MMIATLFVQTNGCYYGLDGIDPWDERRDARAYPGRYPVVAHPPCHRWGKMWFGQPLAVKLTGKRKVKGDDGGCFASALASVRRWGGVLEHPAGEAMRGLRSASETRRAKVAGSPLILKVA
jgi:hypothetical protein